MGDYIMKAETKQLARDIFANIMTNATGIGEITKEERDILFKEAAQLCFEAVSTFEAVESDF
jgi:hypothetical protein